MGELYLAFSGGLLAGIAITVLFSFLSPKRLLMRAAQIELPEPAVVEAVCANGVLKVDSTPAAQVGNLKLCGVYVAVFDNQPTSIPNDPKTVSGAVRYEPGAALAHTIPAGLTGPRDWVVVWAEYCGTRPSAAFPYDTCQEAPKPEAPRREE